MVIVGVRSKYTAKAPPLAMSSYGSNFLSLLRWPKMANEVRGGIPGIPMTPVSPLEDEPSYSDDWRFIGCTRRCESPMVSGYPAVGLFIVSSSFVGWALKKGNPSNYGVSGVFPVFP